MEKQEILEKSRRENQKGDERERTIRMEGESFSLILVFLVGVVIVVYRLARRRNTSDIVTLLISLAFLIWNLVKFFQMA